MIAIILGVIAAILLLLLLALVYSGLLASINVSVGPAPLESSLLVYKFYRRPYKQCGAAFEEVTKLFVGLTCVGIYYDDPDKVEASNCRHCVGAIADGSKDYLNALKERAESHGYMCLQLPTVKRAMLATFPFRTILSIYLSIFRVYPKLQKYTEEHKIMPHPYLEVYKGSTIHFVAPLEQNKKFYVREFFETEGEECKFEGLDF